MHDVTGAVEGAADERGFRRWYGASWWHLLVLVAQLVVVVYAITKVVGSSRWWEIALWFAGAVALQDFVLLPLLLVGDQLLRRLTRGAPSGPVSLLNHLRVPLLLAAVLLLVYWPLVLRDVPQEYRLSTGLSIDPFLWRWVAVSSLLMAGSAALYLVRRARRRIDRPPSRRGRP